jgi:hypothetical protein
MHPFLARRLLLGLPDTQSGGLMMASDSVSDTRPNRAASVRSLPPSSTASVPFATPVDEDDGTAPAGGWFWADDDEWEGPYGAARLGIP